MTNIQKIGPLTVILLAIIPLYVWFPDSAWNTSFDIYRSLGQATALVGATLFFTNFILAARFRIIENLFFGLNRVFIIHHLVGTWALIFLLFHPIFIILSNLTLSLKSAFLLILPSVDNLPATYGLSSLLLIIILLIITLYMKLHYDTWKSTHQWMGLALALGFLHTLTVPSTISTNSPLAIFIFLMATIASVSFIYRMLVKYFRLTSLPYTVQEVQINGNVVEIKMKSVSKNIMFTPGQFVFISVDKYGIRRESHPFSITSKLTDNFLSIGAKIVGDYTETLKLLTPGSKVYVEGAYGRFSYEYFKNKKQLWIAGGIGITPFMSMVKNISADYDVQLYYLVGNISEAVFENEIKRIVTDKQNIKFNVYESSIKGRLEAKNLQKLIPDIRDHEIFICGPVGMMYSLKKQFRELGVKPSQIHTEEFALN